jgi:two-component system, OmpR family, phosphate regulon response regulator PhoB
MPMIQRRNLPKIVRLRKINAHRWTKSRFRLRHIAKCFGHKLMSEQIIILIVEDEAHIRKVLEYNLKLDGFEVYMAEDGAAGLKLAREKSPDVILLDWLMPVMNGLQVLAELKADNSTEHIPVFMLTAKGMLSDVTQALETGADDYITKPFNPVQLGKTIREKLEKCAKVKKY